MERVRIAAAVTSLVSIAALAVASEANANTEVRGRCEPFNDSCENDIFVKGDGEDDVVRVSGGRDGAPVVIRNTAGLYAVGKTCTEVSKTVAHCNSVDYSGGLAFNVQPGDGDDVVVIGGGLYYEFAEFYGGLGRDRFIGGAASEVAWGYGGADVLIGGPGDEELEGGPGPDRLEGGYGRDTIGGGYGADELRGGPSADRARGQRGRDFLRMRDGSADRLIDCGPGPDRIAFDRRVDHPTRC